MYVLASGLAPGDSGGALVDSAGQVIGMAFAIDPGRNATAYALTDAEIMPVLRARSARRHRSTPANCLVS